MAVEERAIRLRVNGRSHRVFVTDTALLLNVLRDQLQVMGPKYGCGIGECGACSVLIDGELTLSCITPVLAATDREVTTVEGVAEDPVGRAVAQQFLSQAAVQCGFCTPGMLVAATSLLRANSRPNETEIREHLRGNLCRCTGYAALVRAVSAAADDLNSGRDSTTHAG